MKKYSLIFILIIAIFFVILSSTAYAAKLQVPIPGAGDNLTLPEYIQAIYNYALSIVGILATVVIMFGGLLWVMAGGNASKIDNAKSWVTAGVTGFVLLMMSYTLLYFINPSLVSFSGLKVTAPSNNNQIQNKSMLEIKNQCEKECSSGGYSYDPKTDRCNCYGTGSHKECQLVRGTSYDEYKCVTVNFPGIDSCFSDSQCKQNLGCCQCIWKSAGVTFNTTCTSGTMFTSQQSCKDHCGWLPNYSFTPNATCNKSRQCVSN